MARDLRAKEKEDDRESERDEGTVEEERQDKDTATC